MPENSGNTWIRNPDNAMIHSFPISEFVELELQEGNIVERGSHSNLIKLNGLYKKLIDLQKIS